MKNAREIVAIILCVTVSLSILATVAGMAIHGPEHVKDEGRRALENTLSLLIGIVSGWLLAGGKDDKKPTP